MGKEVRARHPRGKRTVAFAIGVAILLVLFVTGLVFVNSVGAARVADNARSLHWANSALGTSALARAGVVQAVTFVSLEEQGLVSAEDAEFAMDQVLASMADLEALDRAGQGHPSSPELTVFLTELQRAIGALERGEIDDSRDIVVTDMERAYIDLEEALRTEQASIQAAIDDNTETASRLNSYVLFFLTLAVPATAVLSYWLIARRQLREYRLKTEIELETERAVSRAKDEFIAGLSHELRTPLTSIYGFAEVLADGETEGESSERETARIIANEAAEMSRMVDDLLAASRLESTGIEVEMVPTSVDEVVESAIAPFERAGLEVRRKPSQELVYSDPARLRHVLVNLLSNAVRHGHPPVGVEVSTGEGIVDIEVWDCGPGVPDDRASRLFDRYVHEGRAPLLTGSVGLGLAVASRLAALIGGELKYQRFGAKSYFIVTLPAVASEYDPDEVPPVSETIKAMSG